MEDDKPQILLWTAPGCPFRVTIPSTVLNETRIHAVEAFYSVPRGGVEIGGVFFGVYQRNTIHIQAHRPIRCEYATGPSFTLSVNDQLGLSGLLDQSRKDPDLAGTTPVGWYHSHTRSEIFLSPVDLQLYNDFFHERWQIALVLRPANFQPTKAGFFFRDRLGNVKTDAPVQEFKLEPPNFGLTLLDGDTLAAVPAIDASPVIPASLPIPAIHATPVIPVPPPAAPPVPVVAEAKTKPVTTVLLAAAESVSSPAHALVITSEAPIVPTEPPPVAIVAAAAGNGSGVLVAEAPAIRTPDTVPEAEVVQVLERIPEPVVKVEPEMPVPVGLRSFDRAEASANEKRRTGWIWALAIIMLLSAGGGAAFLKWGRIDKPVGLGLETYDINGAFLIRWDRLSTAVLNASHATLEIEDGGEKSEPITLSPAELAVGGYGYMRRTARVSVHMKVDGAMPMDEYSNFEAIRALGSKPPDAPEAANALTLALEEKEHLKTELLNESMQSTELRREIASLRRQLAEARAKKPSDSTR